MGHVIYPDDINRSHNSISIRRLSILQGAGSVNRDELIQSLVAERFHQIVEQRRSAWLLGILEHGFKGYAHHDLFELTNEALHLSINLQHETPAANEGDFHDGSLDTVELSLLASDHRNFNQGLHADD
jgi:hypothetical protein